MGIFDEVFGRKIEGDGGGLFSDKCKAERALVARRALVAVLSNKNIHAVLQSK